MSVARPTLPREDFYTDQVADVYDILFPPDGPQVDEEFFARRLAHNRGPALEIGVGTGRLLLRLVERGLEVEGLDLAEDMLRICHERARARGLSAALHHASMVDFNLGRTFATVFVPFFSFQVLTRRTDAQACLDTMFRHTRPGGETIITTWMHWEDLGPERPWKLIRDGTCPRTGLFVTSSAASRIDRTEQLQTNWFRYDTWREGKLIDSTSRVETIRFYHKHEIVMMFERAGFVDVRVWGDESEDDATDAHTSWSVLGRRAG
jgi:SAM-dependent methyltransferase